MPPVIVSPLAKGRGPSYGKDLELKHADVIKKLLDNGHCLTLHLVRVTFMHVLKGDPNREQILMNNKFDKYWGRRLANRLFPGHQMSRVKIQHNKLSSEDKLLLIEMERDMADALSLKEKNRRVQLKRLYSHENINLNMATIQQEPITSSIDKNSPAALMLRSIREGLSLQEMCVPNFEVRLMETAVQHDVTTMEQRIEYFQKCKQNMTYMLAKIDWTMYVDCVNPVLRAFDQKYRVFGWTAVHFTHFHHVSNRSTRTKIADSDLIEAMECVSRSLSPSHFIIRVQGSGNCIFESVCAGVNAVDSGLLTAADLRLRVGRRLWNNKSTTCSGLRHLTPLDYFGMGHRLVHKTSRSDVKTYAELYPRYNIVGSADHKTILNLFKYHSDNMENSESILADELYFVFIALELNINLIVRLPTLNPDDGWQTFQGGDDAKLSITIISCGSCHYVGTGNLIL